MPGASWQTCEWYIKSAMHISQRAGFCLPLYAEACREGRPTRAPIDAGDPVGYTTRIADPDGHSLELSFGQEVGLTVQSAAKA
jgi:hypothetical protein